MSTELNETKNIVMKWIDLYFNDEIKTLKFKKHSGYYTEKEPQEYTKNIGLELINKNIKFKSVYDVSISMHELILKEQELKIKDPKNSQIISQKINDFKKIPSYSFLNSQIETTKQKEILLKTMNALEILNNMIGINAEIKLKIMKSVANLFSELKELGINNLLINDKFTEKIQNIKGWETAPDAIMYFIEQGFAFEQGFIEEIKPKNPLFIMDAKKTWEIIESYNKKNLINVRYNRLHEKILQNQALQEKLSLTSNANQVKTKV